MKAIEYLVEVKVTKQQIDALGPEVAGVLATASFAITEINTLMRMVLFSSHAPCGDSAIELADVTQKLVLLRIWSAKLFEFLDFITFKKSNTVSAPALASFAETQKGTLSKVLQGPGYNLARDLRHEATNHYLLNVAKKNLKHVTDKAKFVMYFHEMSGNSFYPIGEEVMFAGRLNRSGASTTNGVQNQAQIQLWVDWSLRASNFADSWFSALVQEFLLKRYPELKGRRLDHWIPPEMVGEIGDHPIPLFVRRSK